MVEPPQILTGRALPQVPAGQRPIFVVMPLVFASLAAGVSQLGDLARLGPLSARTFTLFFLNMSIACALGLLMMNVLQPGNRLDEETSTRLIQEYSGQAQQHVARWLGSRTDYLKA